MWAAVCGAVLAVGALAISIKGGQVGTSVLDYRPPPYPTPPGHGRLGPAHITETRQKQKQRLAVVSQLPPLCPNQDPTKDQCKGSGEDCELCISANGYCKPTGGTIEVSKVQGKGSLSDYYFLNVMVPVGHRLRVILTGSDGYTKSWEEYNSVWSDKIHKPGSAARQAGTTDHLQVQDLLTGEIAFFRFPCGTNAAQLTGPVADGAANLGDEEEGSNGLSALIKNLYSAVSESRSTLKKLEQPGPLEAVDDSSNSAPEPPHIDASWAQTSCPPTCIKGNTKDVAARDLAPDNIQATHIDKYVVKNGESVGTKSEEDAATQRVRQPEPLRSTQQQQTPPTQLADTLGQAQDEQTNDPAAAILGSNATGVNAIPADVQKWLEEMKTHVSIDPTATIKIADLGVKPVPTEVIASAKQAEDEMNADDQTP